MFNADAYLERLGVSRAACADEDFLNTLIYAHQCTIPFEDIDVYDLGFLPSLAIDDLFCKVVEKGRGGYCFELNALFAALLRDLGYEVMACRARVVDAGVLCDVNHRANLVRLGDDLLFVDVGLGGPMPPFAVRADGSKQCVHRETYWTEADGDDWVWLKRLRGKGVLEDGLSDRPESAVCLFKVEALPEEAFEALNFEQAGGPDAPFKQERLVNLRLPDGYRAITNDVYVESHGDVKRREPVGENLWKLLDERFGIRIDA